MSDTLDAATGGPGAPAGWSALADLQRPERVRARQDAMLGAVDVGLWYCDLPFDELVWDRKVKEHFWLPADARVTIDTFYARIHAEDRDRTRAAIERAIAEHGPYDIEYRTVAPDGHPEAGAVRWVRAIGYTAYDAAGRPLRFDGVTVDVTAREAARRERERLLAETEAAHAAADLERRRLLATLDQLPVGVHVAEAPSGRLVLDNAALRRIVGEAPASERVADYSADYAGYRPGSAPEAERRLASDEWPLARALATGAPVADELVEVCRADGGRRLVRISATPVRDAEGRVDGGVATVVDVTEREQLLAAERAARATAEAERARAEAASTARAQFLAVMSHELRTPLNAIGGYAELIELGVHGPVTDAQRGALERIQRAQRHLLGLINGVLNYAKVEAGAVPYAAEAVPLDEVLATCEALIAPQVRAKGLTLAYDAPGRPLDGSPLVARADREKVQQVVLNLLSNAVKFTAPGGRVTLASSASGVDAPGMDASGAATGGAVRVRVRDTGIGIAPDQLSRVFEPFVQVDARLTRTQEGTGLGLAISRDLARGMGGDLTVESTPGVGSTFTLTLPAA